MSAPSINIGALVGYGSLWPYLAVIVASNWSSYLVDQRNAIDQTLPIPTPIAHPNFLKHCSKTMDGQLMYYLIIVLYCYHAF
jgi:hypothetical protein